jgi:hypothetical protein
LVLQTWAIGADMSDFSIHILGIYGKRVLRAYKTKALKKKRSSEMICKNVAGKSRCNSQLF